MPTNIEIKARLRDPDRVRRRAAELADGPGATFTQVDHFFAVPRGRLKLRELQTGRGELIAYLRTDQAGPKASSYAVLPLDDPETARAVLDLALGRRGTVRKTRTLFLAGRTRVHLDEVEGLGSFVELEVVLRAGEDQAAGEAEARELMARLGIEPADLVREAYVDLLAAGPAG